LDKNRYIDKRLNKIDKKRVSRLVMTKLFVYGESYVEACGGFGWTNLLKNRLDAEMKNTATGGASSEYAMIQFEESVKNNEITDGDIIIFLLTSIGRVHLEFQRKYPNSASLFLEKEVPRDSPHYEWLKWNRSYIEWYIVHSDQELFKTNRESYIHVMKNYAEAYPKRTVIILQNSLFDAKFPMTNIPSNFLMPQLDLHKISESESIDFNLNRSTAHKSWKWWTEYTMVDFRENHLSIPNHHILSDLIYESIRTKSIDNFSYDKFQRNIIKGRIDSLDKYVELVNSGLLYYHDWKRDILTK
jgi:hypothetical protein